MAQHENNFDFEPVHFLRCHSRMKDDKADIKTKVWCCAFEPDSLSPEKNTLLVATCGANSVCVINVTTGDVVNKYYSDDFNDEFYTVAWTTLHMKEDHKIRRSNIFAVGGRKCTLHLIHPEKKVCFFKKNFKCSKSVSIVSLLFHPLAVSVLFVGFSDGRILVVDVGQPSPPKYDVNLEDVTTLTSNQEIFYLSFSCQCEMLLAATDDGVCGWSVGLSDLNNSAKLKIKRWRFRFLPKPLPGSRETSKHQLVDSIEPLFNGTMIATKCALYGEIYIWNLEDALQSPEGQVVVRPDKILKYSESDNYFMAMGSHCTSKLLGCGDDKGQLWLYNLEEIISDHHRKFEPSVVFPWPFIIDRGAESKRKLSQNVYDIVVNKVTVNHNGEYVVAVTSTNLVCIWKRIM